jgi:hypothetical protein
MWKLCQTVRQRATGRLRSPDEYSFPVVFGGTSEDLQRTLHKLLEPRQAGYIRPALLVDSFLLHQIDHSFTLHLWSIHRTLTQT